MLKRFKLSKLYDFESIDDCETFSISFQGNVLKITFEKAGLSELFTNKGISMLKISFFLNENFLDFDYIPAVRYINHNKFIKNSILKTSTLKSFVEHMKVKKQQLKIYSIFFNQSKCVVIADLIEKGKWQIGNEIQIELLLDEILYEWE